MPQSGAGFEEPKAPSDVALLWEQRVTTLPQLRDVLQNEIARKHLQAVYWLHCEPFHPGPRIYLYIIFSPISMGRVRRAAIQAAITRRALHCLILQIYCALRNIYACSKPNRCHSMFRVWHTLSQNEMNCKLVDFQRLWRSENRNTPSNNSHRHQDRFGFAECEKFNDRPALMIFQKR